MDAAQETVSFPEWPAEWGKKPSRETYAGVRSFIAACDTNQPPLLLESFFKAFKEHYEAFALIFSARTDIAYALMRDTHGQHGPFGAVIYCATGKFVHDLTCKALEDNTEGDERQGVELGEILYRASEGALAQLVKGLNARQCHDLAVHCYHDQWNANATWDDIQAVMNYAFRECRPEAVEGAFCLFEDGLFDYFLESERVSLPDTIDRVRTALRPFTQQKAPADPLVEQFISAHEAQFKNAERFSDRAPIPYDTELAAQFVQEFREAGDLPRAFRCLYHNYPQWAMCVALSLKGSPQDYSAMFAFCPPDARFRIARRELMACEEMDEAEEARYRELCCGGALRLLLHQSGQFYFDPRVYLTGEDELSSFLTLCRNSNGLEAPSAEALTLCPRLPEAYDSWDDRSETARWLAKHGIIEAFRGNRNSVALRELDGHRVRKLREEGPRGFSTAPEASDNPRASELASSFLGNLPGRSLVAFQYRRDEKLYYCSEVADAFFESVPAEHRSRVFAAVYHKSPEIGGMICRSPKDHKVTGEILADLDGEQLAQLLDRELVTIEPGEAPKKWLKFLDNCTVVRILTLQCRQPARVADLLRNLSEDALSRLFTHLYTLTTSIVQGREYDILLLSNALSSPDVSTGLEKKILNAAKACDSTTQRWLADKIFAGSRMEELLRAQQGHAELAERAPQVAKQMKNWAKGDLSAVPQGEIAELVTATLGGFSTFLQYDQTATGAGIDEEFDSRVGTKSEGRLGSFCEVFSETGSRTPSLVAVRWFELLEEVATFCRENHYQDWAKSLGETSAFKQWESLAPFVSNHLARRLYDEAQGGHPVELGVVLPQRAIGEVSGRVKIVNSENPVSNLEELKALGDTDIVVLQGYPPEYSSTGEPASIITGTSVGEQSHDYHRAQELQRKNALLGLYYFPDPCAALEQFHDKWVTLKQEGDVINLRLASPAEIASNISRRIPGFLPDELVEGDRIIKAADFEANLPHVVGMKAHGCSELGRKYPDRVEKGSFTLSFPAYGDYARQSRGAEGQSLMDIIQESTRIWPMSTVEGSRQAASRIQGFIDQYPPTPEDLPDLWPAILGAFGRGEKMVQPCMARVTQNVEDRDGLNAPGLYLSLPILAEATQEHVFLVVRELFKSPFKADVIRLREKYGVSHTGTGVGIFFDRMPAGKFLTGGIDYMPDGRISAAFCIGHGAYLMEKGRQPAFKMTYEPEEKKVRLLAPPVPQQCQKLVACSDLKNPYVTADLSNSERKLQEDLGNKKIPPAVVAAIKVLLADREPGRKREFVLAPSDKGDYEVIYHQDRPLG